VVLYHNLSESRTHVTDIREFLRIRVTRTVTSCSGFNGWNKKFKIYNWNM